jgi:hypothetical protein
MLFLVDWDNIRTDQRRLGVVTVVEKMIQHVASSVPPTAEKLRFKLYGGWYEDDRLTHYAQRLSAGINADFPRVISVPTGAGARPMIAMLELALALEVRPTEHLFRTYRRRHVPSNLRAESPRDHGCGDDHCPLLLLDRFINDGRCPTPGCGMTVDQVLFVGQQKLVDAMLLSDLLYAVHQKESSAVVVSSDDDLWPGIVLASACGLHVVHLHTLVGRSTPRFYSRMLQSHYTEIAWEAGS